MAKTQPRGSQILDNTVRLEEPEQDVTGVLPVANGGTGVDTITADSLVVGAGTSSVTEIAPGAEGQVLTTQSNKWVAADATGGGLTEDLSIAYAVALG